MKDEIIPVLAQGCKSKTAKAAASAVDLRRVLDEATITESSLAMQRLLKLRDGRTTSVKGLSQDPLLQYPCTPLATVVEAMTCCFQVLSLAAFLTDEVLEKKGSIVVLSYVDKDREPSTAAVSMTCTSGMEVVKTKLLS